MPDGEGADAPGGQQQRRRGNSDGWHYLLAYIGAIWFFTSALGDPLAGFFVATAMFLVFGAALYTCMFCCEFLLFFCRGQGGVWQLCAWACMGVARHGWCKWL